MTLKLPQIIGHRGACEYAPENTIESIATAADLETQWVELDVKITKDGVPILMHDDTLDRTTNGFGLVAAATYEDTQSLEAGSWFAESFSGVKIPTLEEAVETIIEYDLGLNLEIKPCPGRDKETAEAALDILSQYWDDHDKLLISSFSHECLEVAMGMAPNWHRDLLLGQEWPEDWEEVANHFKVSAIGLDGNACSDEQINRAKAIGVPLLAFTINDPARARELQALGVHSIFSDCPDVIQDGLLTLHINASSSVN